MASIQFDNLAPTADVEVYGTGNAGDPIETYVPVGDEDGTGALLRYTDVGALDRHICELRQARKLMNDRIYADRSETVIVNDVCADEQVFIDGELVTVEVVVVDGVTAVVRYRDCDGVEHAHVCKQADPIVRVTALPSLASVGR